MTLQLADFKDREGLWVKSFRDKVSGAQVHTRASILWDNLTRRVKAGEENPTYVGVKVGFKDFQEFVEWCSKQTGYYETGWELDKDLLSGGSKVYSPANCAFVPREINLFLSLPTTLTKELPVGVYYKRGKFVAECSGTMRASKHLGYYDNLEDAVNAYAYAKKGVAIRLANKWKGAVDDRVYQTLLEFEVFTKNQLLRETQ